MPAFADTLERIESFAKEHHNTLGLLPKDERDDVLIEFNDMLSEHLEPDTEVYCIADTVFRMDDPVWDESDEINIIAEYNTIKEEKKADAFGMFMGVDMMWLEDLGRPKDIGQLVLGYVITGKESSVPLFPKVDFCPVVGTNLHVISGLLDLPAYEPKPEPAEVSQDVLTLLGELYNDPTYIDFERIGRIVEQNGTSPLNKAIMATVLNRYGLGHDVESVLATHCYADTAQNVCREIVTPIVVPLNRNSNFGIRTIANKEGERSEFGIIISPEAELEFMVVCSSILGYNRRP